MSRPHHGVCSASNDNLAVVVSSDDVVLVVVGMGAVARELKERLAAGVLTADYQPEERGAYVLAQRGPTQTVMQARGATLALMVDEAGVKAPLPARPGAFPNAQCHTFVAVLGLPEDRVPTERMERWMHYGTDTREVQRLVKAWDHALVLLTSWHDPNVVQPPFTEPTPIDAPQDRLEQTEDPEGLQTIPPPALYTQSSDPGQVRELIDEALQPPPEPVTTSVTTPAPARPPAGAAWIVVLAFLGGAAVVFLIGALLLLALG